MKARPCRLAVQRAAAWGVLKRALPDRCSSQTQMLWQALQLLAVDHARQHRETNSRPGRWPPGVLGGHDGMASQIFTPHLSFKL